MNTMPDPEEMRRLMTSVVQKVEQRVAILAALASDYGVHGTPHGPFSGAEFQITRVNSKWTVYTSRFSGAKTELLSARADEKMIFLEHADQIEKAYRDRIKEFYDQLRKLG